MELVLPDAEIERLLTPWVHEELPPTGDRWREQVRLLDAKAGRQKRKGGWRALLGFRRATAQVRNEYDKTIWPEYDLANRLRPKGDAVPLVWGNRTFLAGDMATKRVHLLALMRVIAALRPRRVLEVGSGVGFNLLALAPRFPEIHFTGLELTAAGVAAARAACAAPLPPALFEFAPEPLTAPDAVRAIEWVEADAAKMPFADASFDLVFTALALEQVESIRARALAEVARVSSGHVAMVEPFRDWNADGARRALIVGKEYFAASIADLAAYGMEPELVIANMPTKLAMGVGLVLARVKR